MDPVIIALSGKKGAGKNTVASYIRSFFLRDYYSSCEFSFADHIKRFCIDVLGLKEKQCYGTDEEKNAPTKYLWENTPAFRYYPLSDVDGEPKGPMTGREVMQVFGTECVRAWFGNVWAEATLRSIKEAGVTLAVITDNRFPSETELILEYPRGYVIRLTRSPYEGDGHESEVALDEFNWKQERCYTLDNKALTIKEQEQAVTRILDEIFHQEFK